MSQGPALRLFAAVTPPGTVLDRVRDLSERMREGALGSQDGLRWTRRDQWHVTLAFFGNVEEARVAELVDRLERAGSRRRPFELQLCGAGRFSSRVLWLGIGLGSTPLRDLARSTGAAGRRLGLEVHERRYHPHLTLARASRPVDLHPWVEQLRDWETASWTVTEYLLVRSDAGPHPTYETLATFGLTRRPTP